MSLSKWDLLVSPNPSNSNVQCFLDCVTPILSLTQKGEEKEIERWFSLKDLWSNYVEWSICGASVPILLDNGESVVQYYSPSLSALQIFTTESSVSSSDFIDEEESPYCQFTETTSPYSRVPLTEKIVELAKTYPDLLNFKSTDVSPCSWISVAWYPIYPIPVLKNAKELSACFLTYHKLSTLSLQGDLTESSTVEEQNHSGEMRIAPFAMATYKMCGSLWINSDNSDENLVASYLNAASSWLNQRRFWHHDFDFFLSRRNSPS